jgi:hypothetical protein
MSKCVKLLKMPDLKLVAGAKTMLDNDRRAGQRSRETRAHTGTVCENLTTSVTTVLLHNMPSMPDNHLTTI